MRRAGSGPAVGSCFCGGCLSAIFGVDCGVGSFFPGVTVSGGSYFTGALGCFGFFGCICPPGGKTLVPGFVVGGLGFGFFLGGAVVGVGLVVRRRAYSIVVGGGVVAVSVAGGGVWRRAGWLSGGCSAARGWRGHSPAGCAGFLVLL